MRSTLQTIFREHLHEFAQTRSLHPREQRAAQCIRDCYSDALGSHTLSCPNGHGSIVQHHACRHRSCPRCAARPRQQWLKAELERLLPCPHFHIVFTLPHALMGLWEFNRRRINQLLFDCARQSLLELCANERHLGASPGILMSLHTWGRTLSRHPHVHCLVSAGGVDDHGQWKSCQSRFLVPVKPLQHLFRGKLLSHLSQALNGERLHLPTWLGTPHWKDVIAQQYRRHWNVRISEPYTHGRGVALYLARYVKGGPLPSDRSLDLTDDKVSFGYTDHRDQRRKTLHLQAREFIERVLWHAPPQAQHTVRHAGLYATTNRVQHRYCSRQLTQSTPPQATRPIACHHFVEPSPPSCRQCDAPLVRSAGLTPHRFGEFTLPSPARCGSRPTDRSNGHAIGFAAHLPLT
jgi:hypothetical protein